MAGAAAGRETIGHRQEEGREDEGEVNRHLPEDHLFGQPIGLDEALEQMNRRDADERGGQLPP